MSHIGKQLSNWIWGVPILLIVSFLAFQQIDLYSPSHVEFKTLFNAGAMADDSYSILDTYYAVTVYSAQHMPGYFMLLNVWGNLTSWDVATMRIPAIFASLLSLVVMYRLGHDFVTPIGGLFAMILLASNAFFAYYIPQIRMYPSLLLFGAIVLWLYLRIIYQSKSVQRMDYIALFASAFVLLWIHIFGALFLGVLGLYHLLIAPKSRHWLWVSVSVTTAVLLVAPYFTVILDGSTRAVDKRADRFVGFVETNELLSYFLLNGQFLLLVIIGVGLAVCVLQYRQLLQPYLLLGIMFLLASGMLAELIPIVTDSGMRYFLVGWPVVFLLAVPALVGLYRLRPEVAIFSLGLFVGAGIALSSTLDWQPYLEGRYRSFLRSPIHSIARVASQQPVTPTVIEYYTLDTFMTYEDNISYSQQDYFLRTNNIAYHLVESESESESESDLIDFVTFRTLNNPTIWIFYKQSGVDEDMLDELYTDLEDSSNYTLCETQPIGEDTLILKYYWSLLDCQLPQLSQQFESPIMTYNWGDVTIDGDRLYFTDQWQSDEESSVEDYSISHQLLTLDWEKVTQLDLPLVNESDYRLFSLNIADVQAGTYRLVSVVYNNSTGERVEWMLDGQSIGGLITLSEVTIG